MSESPSKLLSTKITRRSARYRRLMESLRIRNERSQIVPMAFSGSQEILWRFVAPQLDNDERLWYIVVKPRQAYSTTFWMNLAFVRTLEQPNTHSLIIAHDLDSSSEIFNMVKRFYDYMPLPKIRPSKAKELVIPLAGGNSRFKVTSAGVAAKGRGTTQTCLICSEVAHWEHAEVMTGLFQTMPDLEDTVWVLESTANGMVGHGSLFYDQWKMAIAAGSNSKFSPIFIPWFIMPKYKEEPPVPESEWDEEEKLLIEHFGRWGLDGRSLRWRRNTIATKTQGLVELFHQEYPSTAEEAFISSGLPAFDPLAILRQQSNIRPPTKRGTFIASRFLEMRSGELLIWEEPKANHQYAIGVDTSEGLKGGDYACAQIIDMGELEQVGIIHGMIQPYDLAKLLCDVGKWYNNALVNIEVKSTGYAVQDYMLRTFMYPYLHPWRGKPDRVSNAPARLWGWDTNVYSRPLLIESGRRAINTGLITLRDEATLMEIKHFSRQDDGKYEASAGHDDRVLALLLALRSRDENFISNTRRMTEPTLSDEDFMGVRVLDAAEPDRMGMKRIHKVLKDKAREGVNSWLKM